jgi:hypothetical protein
LLIAPVPFTNQIMGYILEHDGTSWTNDDFPPPPVYSGPNGVFLLGDKAPITDVGTNIFVNILGRPPFPGEQAITLSGTNTYLGNGAWDSVPVLEPAQSAFLNIMAPPPPELNIVRENNQVVVSWPCAYTNWILQTNSSLTDGNWGNYSGPIVSNSVTNSPTPGQLYYRLFY